MTHAVDQKLAELGITLPSPPAPVAAYVPFVVAGKMLYVSGQIPIENGAKLLGRVGEDIGVDQGVAAARACCINILAQVRAAVGGDWSKVKRCVKLGGFVSCTPDFTDHPKVVNGASDLMVAVFGEAGKHARFAVGALSLPFGVAVEVDAVFELV